MVAFGRAKKVLYSIIYKLSCIWFHWGKVGISPFTKKCILNYVSSITKKWNLLRYKEMPKIVENVIFAQLENIAIQSTCTLHFNPHF